MGRLRRAQALRDRNDGKGGYSMDASAKRAKRSKEVTTSKPPRGSKGKKLKKGRFVGLRIDKESVLPIWIRILQHLDTADRAWVSTQRLADWFRIEDARAYYALRQLLNAGCVETLGGRKTGVDRSWALTPKGREVLKTHRERVEAFLLRGE